MDFKLDKSFSPEDAAALRASWDEAEIKRALAEMASGKTLGRDGLPKELWESQWDLLGGQVMKFLKEFERTAALPAEFSTVFGFLPGRSLVGAVAITADAIDAANSEGEDWLLLLVDFRKAFDSISRGYLFDVLRRMGFPDEYVKWVEGLHQGAATRICNDGWLGDEVPVQTEVRQGCPLAPYLILCAVEPLCQEAQRRQLGVDITGAGKLTYLGYADDTTFLLKGRAQLDMAEKLLCDFARVSGLAANCDKTVVMPLGRQRDEQPPPVSLLKWAARDEREGVPPPPDAIWEELRRLCHAFVSGGRASAGPRFILWSAELMQMRRSDGGLGLINLRNRLDAEALHSVGGLLTEESSLRRILAEKAARLPLGYASFYAHEALL
ncbi:unnamed protein product [Closterium sp. Naga37s-1]|nr:unnamed protein product [Closterium sp. Naga37s-1]